MERGARCVDLTIQSRMKVASSVLESFNALI